MWNGFHKEPYNVDLNREAMFGPSIKLWGGSIRPALGTTINFDGYTSKAYLDARWQWERANNMFYAVGLGIAVHNGETFTERSGVQAARPACAVPSQCRDRLSAQRVPQRLPVFEYFQRFDRSEKPRLGHARGALRLQV